MGERPPLPHVHLKSFSGSPKENFNQFEGLFRASLAVARIPEEHNQRARYLHLHLSGNALNFYLSQPDATRDDVEAALTALRDRYAGLDKRAKTDALLSNRKFNSETEEPDDFLTDLQRLAAVAIPSTATVDRADERTRRVRHQFIEGMPYKLKKVLLREPDNTNTEELCRIVKLRIRAALSVPESDIRTAFNEVTTEPAAQSMIEALTHITSVTQSLQAQQDELSNQFANMATNMQSSSQDYRQRNNSGYQRGSYRGKFRGNSRSQSTGQRTYNNNNFCRICGKTGHTQQKCWYREAPRRGSSIPYQQQRNTAPSETQNDSSKN